MSRLACLPLLAALASSSIAQEKKPPLHTLGPTNAEVRAARVYRESLPAVVTVTTRLGAGTSLGSGVIISRDGHVLTAAHVVDGGDEILVQTQDGHRRKARLVYSEPGADVALLRLEAADRTLAHAPLGDSDRLAVGHSAYVIGAPNGLRNSFSVGTVSGFRDYARLYDDTIIARFIQTDAAINTGNSGGPVFDSRGRVVGIASRIITRSGGFEGIGLVVSINTVKQLLALEDRPWIGVQGIYLTRTELAALFHVDAKGGLLVQRVAKGSPAARAGIRPGRIPAEIAGRKLLLGGDVILTLGGRPACDNGCLAHAAGHAADKKKVRAQVLRMGRTLTVTIDASAGTRGLLPRAGGG